MLPSKQNVRIFAYGSNMDLAQMKERCPNSDLTSFVAEARGWRLCFPRESKKRKGGVGSVERAEGSAVWGVVFSVNGSDLKSLDSHEGVPRGRYTRGPIEVYDERPILTETYFAVRMQEQDFTPHRDYIELYIRGARHFGLPAHYIEFLERIRDQAKSD